MALYSGPLIVGDHGMEVDLCSDQENLSIHPRHNPRYKLSGIGGGEDTDLDAEGDEDIEGATSDPLETPIAGPSSHAQKYLVSLYL